MDEIVKKMSLLQNNRRFSEYRLFKWRKRIFSHFFYFFPDFFDIVCELKIYLRIPMQIVNRKIHLNVSVHAGNVYLRKKKMLASYCSETLTGVVISPFWEG